MHVTLFLLNCLFPFFIKLKLKQLSHDGKCPALIDETLFLKLFNLSSLELACHKLFYQFQWSFVNIVWN